MIKTYKDKNVKQYAATRIICVMKDYNEPITMFELQNFTMLDNKTFNDAIQWLKDYEALLELKIKEQPYFIINPDWKEN